MSYLYLIIFISCHFIRPLHYISEGNVLGLRLRYFHYRFNLSISFFQKTVKNVDHCFPKPEVTSSNVLFGPQPKEIQFTVREE